MFVETEACAADAFFPHRKATSTTPKNEYQVKTTEDTADSFRVLVRTLFPRVAAAERFTLSGSVTFPQTMAPIGRWHSDPAQAPLQLPGALCDIDDPKHAISVTIVAASLSAAFLLRIQHHPDGLSALPTLELETMLQMHDFYERHAQSIATATAAAPPSPVSDEQQQQAQQAEHARQEQPFDEDIPLPGDVRFERELQQLELPASEAASTGELRGSPNTAAAEGIRIHEAADSGDDPEAGVPPVSAQGAEPARAGAEVRPERVAAGATELTAAIAPVATTDHGVAADKPTLSRPAGVEPCTCHTTHLTKLP